MAQRVKSMKQKLANGTYSAPIPFGADGINIDLQNGYNLESTLGTVAVETKGTVQAQLDNRYTKTEVDDLMSSMINWETVENWYEIVLYYIKSS